jgi:hypothetical protein
MWRSSTCGPRASRAFASSSGDIHGAYRATRVAIALFSVVEAARRLSYGIDFARFGFLAAGENLCGGEVISERCTIGLNAVTTTGPTHPVNRSIIALCAMWSPLTERDDHLSKRGT